MTSQRLKITSCGNFPSQPGRYTIFFYEPAEGGQYILHGDPKAHTPLKLEPFTPEAKDVTQIEAEYWVCENQVFRVGGADVVPKQELLTRIQQAALNEVEKLKRIGRSNNDRRERITDDVRRYVWRRDQGKCVRCGSQERLEYDHIIPVAKGGNNTNRNIQLLCETCNRRKGATI